MSALCGCVSLTGGGDVVERSSTMIEYPDIISETSPALANSTSQQLLRELHAVCCTCTCTGVYVTPRHDTASV